MRCGARSRSRARTRCRPTPSDRLGAFCELVSLAVASAQARADLIASRARLVEAGDEQRRRLERNLHDGAQQHLVSVAVKLRVARTQLETKPEVTAKLLEEALSELGTGLEELREIARGLHPAILSEHGLCRALEVLADRLRVAVDVDVLHERLPGAHRGDGVLHRLRGADQRRQARRGRPARASRVRRDGDVLRCEISDDGRGGADPTGGSGLVGLRDRAEAAGGTLSVDSPPGRGTVVTAVAAALAGERLGAADNAVVVERERGAQDQAGGAVALQERAGGRTRASAGRLRRPASVTVRLLVERCLGGAP